MKTHRAVILLVSLAVLAIAGCTAADRVGPLQTETRSVDLDDATSVRVEINFGAGDLNLDSGAAGLLEADFSYNVPRLKPDLAYNAGQLTIHQPEDRGLSGLSNIGAFQNQWDLRLHDTMPMELSIDVGAGSSDLHLGDLDLTRLDFSQGAGVSVIDLSGDWAHDLDMAIDSGAADVTLRLPNAVGVRVDVDAGPALVDASGLSKEGSVYTNAAYGRSNVTLDVDLSAGVGLVHLEVVE